MTATPARPEVKAAGRDVSIRVSPEARRRLLTMQYARKMAGEVVSIREIVDQLLERAS